MKKDVLAISLLGALILGFFHPLIFLDQLPSFRDMYTFIYPIKVFAASSIRRGLVPLWDPYSGAGLPFCANLPSQVFYPPNFLFYLLPINLALKLFIVLHFFLAGGFTYLFARQLGLSRISALISAIVFTFGGSLVSMIDTNLAFCTIIWLPLVLFCGQRMLQTFKLKWIFLTGLTLAIQFLAGFPEGFLLTSLLIGFMALLKGPETIGGRRQKPALSLIEGAGGRKWIIAGLRLPAVCLLSFTLATGLIMFQLLPFLELMGLSTRSQGLTYELASQGALHPGHLLTLLIPGFYGNPMEIRPTPIPEGWLKGLYIGLLPLILAVLAPFLGPEAGSRKPAEITGPDPRLSLWNLLVALSGLAILLSLGDHFFLYRLLFPLGLYIFRFPSKLFILAAFTLSLLSGYGLDGLQALVRHSTGKERRLQSPGQGGRIGAPSSLCRGPDSILRKRQATSLLLIILTVSGILGVLAWTKWGLPLIPKLYRPTAAFTPELVRAFFSQTLGPSFQFLALLLLSSGMLLLALHQKLSLPLFRGLVLALVTSDLFVHNSPLMPVVDSRVFGFPTRTIEVLKADLDETRCGDNSSDGPKISPCIRPFRTYSTPLTQDGVRLLLATQKYDEQAILMATDLLIPNVGLIFQIPNVTARGAVELASYEQYLHRLESLLKSGSDTLLDRLGVKYVISTSPLNVPGLDLIRGGAIKIFQNKNFLPRAYKIPNKELFDLPETPGDLVIPLRIEQPSPHYLKIELPEAGGQWLVLSDQYYPGWRAYGDGQEMHIQEVDRLFMGLELPSDIHRVEFEYRPGSFKIGWFISLWTILMITAYTAGRGSTGRKGRHSRALKQAEGLTADR